MTRYTIKTASGVQLEARLNELDARSVEEFEGEYTRIMNEQDDRYFSRRNQST